ncbi:MAG: glycosyltransferase family 4 protein [Leptolyngbya sp. Prado105]|jgi:glycosyltransferase involved in cell wall biosynthesis|nr:glycosyltransferase family 4 protein [Leptolyngbya sp. Prado105]
MKVLFFNPVGVIGRSERILLSTIAAIRSRRPGIEITLVVGSAGALIAAGESLGIQVICLSMPTSIAHLGDSHLKGKQHLVQLSKTLLTIAKLTPALLNYLKRLQHLIQRIQPDLIHSNGIKAHVLLGLLGRLNCPVIWHIQDFYSTRPIMARVLKGLSRSTSGAIALSHAVKQDAESLIKAPIQVIYPAIDSHYFRVEGVRSQVVRIGLVASFARWKGHDIFLQAAAQVMSDVPVQFQIVGAPICRTSGLQVSFAELQNQVKNLGLERVVEFVGFQPETASIYQNLDIIVHASTQPEPFGFVIAEAMAFGKAVIVTNTGGAAELITNQYDAIAVPPGDVAALVQALRQLIQNAQLRQELGQNARRSAIEKFNRDRMADELLQVYERWGGIEQALSVC